MKEATKIFASATERQRLRGLALEAVKILLGEKILCSLTSIRHWAIKFHNIWIKVLIEQCNQDQDQASLFYYDSQVTN